MLGQRRRRWTNINPALGQTVVFPANTSNIVFMLCQRRRRCANIKPTVAFYSVICWRKSA